MFGPSGKGLYGKLVYFIDDLNMSEESEYKVQPPVELLRQWADYGWWADREDLTQKKVIVDVRLVAAMNHKVAFYTMRLINYPWASYDLFLRAFLYLECHITWPL